MPKKQIVIGHKDHGRGGKTGHQSLETQARGNRVAKELEKTKRNQEKNKRKFSAKAERELKKIVDAAKKDLIPLAENAKKTIEKQVKQGGMNTNKFVSCLLAIDEYVLSEIKKRFKENPLVGPLSEEIEWDNFRWLEGDVRTHLFLLLIGKKPTIKKQQRIMKNIESQTKNVPKWAIGRMT